MESLAFNALLLEISNGLSSEQLESLKFLCKEDIKKKEQEKCTAGLKVFQILTERGKLGSNNTDYLCFLLRSIKREDLSQKLQNFNGELQLNRNESETNEKDALDHATEELSENLGRNWRKLGRKLGLTEVKLDSISRKHPSDLEETAVELVKEWRKSKGSAATVKALVEALRDCRLNLTADNVEAKLASVIRNDL